MKRRNTAGRESWSSKGAGWRACAQVLALVEAGTLISYKGRHEKNGCTEGGLHLGIEMGSRKIVTQSHLGEWEVSSH